MSWQQTTLGEIADIVSGSTPKSSVPRYWDGAVAWATPTDLSRLDGKHLDKTDRTITEAGLNECSARLLPPGSVLFSSRAPIGLVAINTTPMATNQGFKSFVPRPELNADYLYWWLRANRRQLEDLGNGATFKEVSKAIVSRVKFPLPPLLEQRRIAAILDKADAIRRKREQALTLADDFLRSVFLEMFGDPAENERGWPISPLGDLGDVQGGLQVTTKRVAMGLTLPYLRVANVYRDRLNLDEIKEINLSEAEFKRVKLEGGDILIVEGHGNPDEIGRAAIWDGSIDPCVHQNHLIRFRANRKHALPDFISRFLNSDGGRQQLIGAGRTTSGLNTISTRKVKEVSVPLPPVALQEQFAHVVRKQVALTSRLLGQKVMANDLFAALSQRAFAADL